MILQKRAEEIAGKARRGLRVSHLCGQEFVITVDATDCKTAIRGTGN